MNCGIKIIDRHTVPLYVTWHVCEIFKKSRNLIKFTEILCLSKNFNLFSICSNGNYINKFVPILREH